MKHKYWLEAVLLCGVMQSAPAQSILKNKDEKELSLLLNEVVVTGTGTEHYLKDAPVQTEVLTGKALDQYQARSIDDLLSGLSPSLTFHDGDMGSHIQLNGLNNDYILIMINGKRMNGDIGGQNDLNQLNPANIERIEIVKGAASSLYGSDAIAGVINIITKRSREKMELTSTTRVGEHGDVRQSASFGFNYGKLKSVTGINFRHTDGWRNTDMQWDQNQLKPGSTMLTVNRSSNYTLSENLEWQVNRKLNLTAEGTYYERWVMRTHGPWKYLPNDFYYRNYTFAAGSRYKLNGRNYLTADLSYGRYGYFYDYKLHHIITDILSHGFSLIKGIFAVRRSSITLKEDYVEINSGKFAEVKNYFKYSNMEVVRMTATPFTPFYHRVNLVISTNGSSFTIRSLKEQEAKEIYELLLYNCYIK